jgi:hypothetical protein
MPEGPGTLTSVMLETWLTLLKEWRRRNFGKGDQGGRAFVFLIPDCRRSSTAEIVRKEEVLSLDKYRIVIRG